MHKFEFSENKIKDALKWFFKKATTYEPNLTKQASKKDNTTRNSSGFHLGAIYVHGYIPKHRLKLPFYDTMPLYIPISMQGDRMHALNLHYIPPSFRAKFFEAMIENLNTQARLNRFNDYTEVPLTQIGLWNYQWIVPLYLREQKVGKLNIIAMTRRTYLFSHIVSQIKPIKVEEWENAAHVVLPAFKKQTAAEIYRSIEDAFYKKPKPRRKK